MSLPIIADVFRVVLKWSDSNTGLTAHNVLHFKTSSSGKTGLQVYTCMNAHVTTQMWNQTSATAKVVEVAVTPLDGVTAASVNATGGPSKWTGASGGQALPQVAAEFSFSTALRGPAHRGRLFLPFVAEDEVNGRTLSDMATSSAAWVTFMNACIADATTPMALGIASYAHSTWEQVTGVNGKTTTYTMGKRNPH